MPTVEKRIAYLEGRLEDHAGTVGSVRQDVANLRQMIQHLDQKVQHLDQKIQYLDQKVDRLFFNLDSKVSRQFVWLVGMQVGVLVAIVGAMFRRL